MSPRQLFLLFLGAMPAMTHAATRPEQANGATSDVTRICMTEWHGFRDSSEADLCRRFGLYEELGVDTIRIGAEWLGREPMVNALKAHPFRIKLILSVLWMTHEYKAKYPDGRTIDERGRPDKHLGPWSPAFGETTRQAGRRHLATLREAGLADRVDEVVVDLGPACEGIYPANWTLQRTGEETYWCYSDRAQADFRAAMQAKYPDLDAANAAWGLTGEQRFPNWDAVAVPKPRTEWARGAFWQDMLTWYRDAKRRMCLKRIEQTQALAREYLKPEARCIVYLPGHAYSQADWDRAVREASGPPSIRLMMDNDWLMKTAIEKGCVLQYTGVENVTEVRRIVSKLKAAGSDAYRTMWGENAGSEQWGRHPGWLAEVITSCELRGVDFTWCKWLFEKDGVTPNETFRAFAHSVRMIRQFYDADERLPPLLPDSAAKQVKPGHWALQCVADTRLLENHPDAIKGNDPQIAAVGAGNRQRILLRFPLELLPAGSRVRSARLSLRRYRSPRRSSESVTLSVYQVAEPWSEIGANWNEALPGKAWHRPGGTASDAKARGPGEGAAREPWAQVKVGSRSADGDVVSWDVTELVRSRRSGGNFGMLIAVDDQSKANIPFASRKHLDPAMRPVLEIEVAGAQKGE